MTITALRHQARAPRRRLPLILSLALREQRNGFGGFYIFIACVALGVAAITGVGALADALRASFERQGEVLLGGDVALSRPHKAADGPERAWLDQQGRVSESATLRAMARRVDGSDQALVDLRGVDAAYPLVGSVKLNGSSLDEAIRREGGAIVDPILLERLNLKIGDPVSIGTLQVPIRAAIETEPDKLTESFTVGPRVLVSLETLRRSGLADPGSLVRWRYALKLADGAGQTDAGLVRFREAVKKGLPEGGFTIRDRRDPSPQISRVLERLRQFLTLVGVTALHGRRGRHRQCGGDLYRPPPQGDRRLQEPRRHPAHHLRHAPAAGGVLCHRRRGHRRRRGVADPDRAEGGVRVAASHSGRVHAVGPQPADRRGERIPRRPAVHAVAAGTRRAGAGGRAVPRRRGARARAAAPLHHRAQCGGRRRSCCAGDLLLRGAAARVLLLPGRDRRVRRLRRPRHGCDLACPKAAPPAPRRACARHRQYWRAGWPHPCSGSLARHRAVAARHGGPGRQLDRLRADGPDARGEPQLLRPRHQARRDRGVRCPDRTRLPRRQGRAGADAARPAGQARRPARRADQGPTRGAMGAHRRPRAVAFRHGAGGLHRRSGHLVAGRLCGRAAGLGGGRHRQEAEDQARRTR